MQHQPTSDTDLGRPGVQFVLLPGRHHLLTTFQAAYLHDLLGGGCLDSDGAPARLAPDATVVWAVTSANHSNTRRNPVAYSRREAAIERFSLTEGIRSVVVPVVDVAPTPRFAQTTLTSALTEAELSLTPGNTVVACSTPAVAQMYRGLGFAIVEVEGSVDPAPVRPWEVLTALAEGRPWKELTHPATLSVYERYALAEHICTVTSDTVVGDEGGLTDTRSYRTYMASFEAAAGRKWEQAQPYVQPGRIVDIGCASGAMLELAAAEPRLHESDLFGVEVARHLYEECTHKKKQGVFAANPNTFFLQRNILTGPAFAERSVNTTLSFALTHEILSCGDGMDSLRAFAQTIYDHTAPGGVWINSDVLGPENGQQPVLLHLLRQGQRADGPVDLSLMDPQVRTGYLDGLDGVSLLEQFAVDFRRSTGQPFGYELLGDDTARLAHADAVELLTKYSYTDNWLSETAERFTALAWSDWVALCTAIGFEVDTRSGPWRNDWLTEHRFDPFGRLTTLDGQPLPWADTHVLLVARRPLTS